MGDLNNLAALMAGQKNVGAAELNALITSATIKPAFVSGQSAKSVPDASDTLLLYDVGTGTFKRVSVSDLVLNPAALINGRSSLGTLAGDDELLVYDVSTGLYAKLTLENLLLSPLGDNYGAESGTANAHVVTLGTGTATPYVGMVVHYFAGATNTGAVTLDVNGLGALDLKDVAGQDLVAGAIRVNYPVLAVQEGALWRMLNQHVGDLRHYGTATGASNAYVLASAVVVTNLALIHGKPLTFAANHTNTGAATLAFSSLAAKDIKARNGRPLPAGAILSGERVTVVYDSGDDCYYLTSQTGTVAPGVTGAARNLELSAIGNSTCTVTADEVVVKSATGERVTITGVNTTVNLDASGAAGLDTGSPAATTWYYIHVIWKESDEIQSTLASLSATAPTLPAGYTHSALLGAVYATTTGPTVLRAMIQRGKQVHFAPVEALDDAVITTPGTYEGVDLSAIVPPETKRVSGTMGRTMTGSSVNFGIAVAADANGLGRVIGRCYEHPNSEWLNIDNGWPFAVPTKASSGQAIYWTASTTSGRGRIEISGFELA